MLQFIETVGEDAQGRDGGGGAERRRRRRKEDEEERRGQRGGAERRSASEGGGGERLRRLRWRVNLLEKQKLQLTSSSNQEVCRLQAEVTRLRSGAERADAQGAELQHQRALNQRDAERIAELSRDKQSATERAAELQKVLHMTRQARDGDQHALQQEVEERDQLIQNFSSENQRLHGLLQEQAEALEETEKRRLELQAELEEEAGLIQRQNQELQFLMEREKRSRREKERADQWAASLEAGLEAERAAHLESKFNCEVVQLRLQDLEAAVAAERSGQQEARADLEAQVREVEAELGRERERGGGAERALQRLQAELQQCRAENTVALETQKKATSDLAERLKEEERRHNETRSLLEEATRRRSDSDEALLSVARRLRDAATPGGRADEPSAQPAMHDGNPSPAEVLQLLTTTLSSYRRSLEDSGKRVQDLNSASQKLREENRALQQLTRDQTARIHESQQVLAGLQEEVTRLHQETSDWSVQSKDLQVELQKEKEERQKEEEKLREEREEEIRKMTECYTKESKDHLTFLHRLHQLLDGCLLPDQPQSILGDFTWKELSGVVQEQVTHLQVLVQELQDLQVRQERVRRREEARTRRHAGELQVCRSQVCSLRDHGSSLELRCSSLTSELSGLRDFVSRTQRESSSFSAACALLAGALRHAHLRLGALAQQKRLLARRLQEQELLEEQVKRLAEALEGEEEEDGEEDRRRRRRRAAGRWRSSVGLVVAVRRWRALGENSTVLFRLEGGAAVCVGAALPGATETHQEVSTGEDSREDVCLRWLLSQRLSSLVLSSVSHLQGALAQAGDRCPGNRCPGNLIPAARSALSRLLTHLLDQSESSISPGGADEGKTTPPQTQDLVSALQQHFLLFSQRLHSAEVERRGLRLQLANQKKGGKETAVARWFRSVCEELHQGLIREQELQMLVQQQAERADVLTQELAEARQEVSRKERSLRILGKHLSGLQKERKHLEERLRRAEDQLSDAARRHECLIRCMKAAEKSCRQVRDELVQSQPSPLPEEHLGGAESIMGVPPRLSSPPSTESIMGVPPRLSSPPAAVALQSFLSSVSQLRHTCRSRVTALQDARLRGNQVPVEQFPETPPFDDPGKAQVVSPSNVTQEP